MSPSFPTSSINQQETEEADYQSGLLQNGSRCPPISGRHALALNVTQNMACYFLVPSVGGFGSISIMNWRGERG